MKIGIQLLSGGLINRGAEHSMLMLAEDLSRLGHSITVFQAGPGPNQVKLPFLPTSHKPTTLIGKVLERLYLDTRSLLSLLFTLKIASQLKQFDILIPTDGFWSVVINKWGKARHAKIICVGLAGIGWTDKNTLQLGPDAFVALSTKAQEWAKKINPNVYIPLIPLQVDVTLFKNATPAPLSLKKPIILTVAALTKYKQINLIIQAVAKTPNASLLIVGQGEEYDSLHTLCEKVLKNRYQIRSATFAELPGIYKSADVFVLLSQSQEAFGQVFLEAMATGLPIVTTDDPIRREIVGKQGIYVDPTNLLSTNKAIQQAIGRRVTYPLDRYHRLTIANQYNESIQKVFSS